MRLDKLFSETGILSRSRCARAAKAGLIAVDGTVVRDPSLQIDPDACTVTYKGEPVEYRKYVYIMMNKPEGYVCSNDEPGELLVFDLLDERYKRKDIFTVGRLDKNTTGLIIITNDGKSAHAALSPKRHVRKKYVYTLAEPLSGDDRIKLESGVELKDGYTTKPCRIIPTGDRSGEIILSEGKYHQIRRMFAAVGNRVETLDRVSFGEITLDTALGRGQWRLLTEGEIALFTKDDGDDNN
ncbi:MAG: rRNA pseudouridine synthase [Clostridia bacterium]|nr:rRNA pseudouridine synthase [Clostridia bacterium]